MQKLGIVALAAALAAAAGCSKPEKPSTPTSPACTFSVSAPNTTFGSSGGAGTANVTTGTACAWSASSQVDWLRVGGETHTGSGSVSFTVLATDGTATRTASLTIASQAIAISQVGGDPPPPTCTVSLSAEPDDYERDGGNGQLRVSAAASCEWALKQDASWLTIEGATHGVGPATLKVSAAPNEDAAARRVTISSGAASAVVVQPGQGDCSFQVGPINTTIPRVPFASDIVVVTSRGCRWTATADASWLHLSAAGGSGSGKIAYHADFNPQTEYAARRTAQVAIRWAAPTAGQNAFVTQWGDCNTVFTPSLDPLPPDATFSGRSLTGSTLTVGANGGEFRLFVLTDPFMGCAWTAESGDTWVNWIFPRLHSVQGGDGDVHFIVPANSSPNGRTAVFTIGERPLTIVQRGR